MMNTPKQNEKSNYTSPIRHLKNTNSSTSAYEQEFYRIKTQRLETEVQQLKIDNHALKNKLVDANGMNQLLRQRIIVLESSSNSRSDNMSFGVQSRRSPAQQSKYKSTGSTDKSTYTAANAQIERLSKELRILKNDHEIEMSKLRDENKKLTRKMAQIQSQKQSQIVPVVKTKLHFEEEKQNSDKLGELQKQNSKLRQNYDQCLGELKDFRSKIRELQENNDKLVKENEENSVLKSSQARSSQNFRVAQEQVLALQEKVVFLQNQNKYLEQRSKTQKSEEISIAQEHQSFQTKKYKKKIIQLQEKLHEKSEQIEEMLNKLKPLLKKGRDLGESSREEKGGDSRRASLSMLQVFLTKYKINLF